MDRCSSINIERDHDNIWRRRYAAANGVWSGISQPSPSAHLWTKASVLWEWKLQLPEWRTVSVRWGTAAGESLRPCRQAFCLRLGFACFVQFLRSAFVTLRGASSPQLWRSEHSHAAAYVWFELFGYWQSWHLLVVLGVASFSFPLGFIYMSYRLHVEAGMLCGGISHVPSF